MAETPTATTPATETTGLRRTVRLLPTVLKREFKKKSQTTPFLIWLSFLITFILSRVWVDAAGAVNTRDKTQIEFEVFPNIVIGGYHIHHIAIGILLLAVAGWLGLHYRGRQIARTSAVMYGVGLGLIVDEIGFVIGNISPYRNDVEVFYLAVAIGALLLSIVTFPSFWRGVREDLRSIAALVTGLPSLGRPRSQAKKEIDREVEEALGPVERHDTDSQAAKDAPIPLAPAPPGEPALPAGAVAAGAVPLDRDALFSRLLGKFIDVLILITFAAMLLGIAKLVLSLKDVLLGLSVTRVMQPILVGVLTLLIGVQLIRAMVEFVRSGRIMLPFLVDAGILLGLRELADELARTNADPILVAVIGATLVALGGLRAFLVRTILPALDQAAET